jgi:hypothetical protein
MISTRIDALSKNLSEKIFKNDFMHYSNFVSPGDAQKKMGNRINRIGWPTHGNLTKIAGSS